MIQSVEDALAAVKKAVEAERMSRETGAFQIGDINLFAAALRAVSPGGPLAVVPREPTKAQSLVGFGADITGKGPDGIYRAMLAASEEQP